MCDSHQVINHHLLITHVVYCLGFGSSKYAAIVTPKHQVSHFVLTVVIVPGQVMQDLWSCLFLLLANVKAGTRIEIPGLVSACVSSAAGRTAIAMFCVLCQGWLQLLESAGLGGCKVTLCLWMRHMCIIWGVIWILCGLVRYLRNSPVVGRIPLVQMWHVKIR